MYYYRIHVVFFLFISNNILFCSYVKNSITSCTRFKDRVTQSLMIDKVPINSDVKIKFNQNMLMGGYQKTISYHEFKHIYKLEKMNQVANIIIQKTNFIRANSSASIILHCLAGEMLSVKDDKHAVSAWRSIKKYMNIHDSWTESQKIFELLTPRIQDIYCDIKHYDKSSDEITIPPLLERIHGDQLYSHVYCDNNQIEQNIHPIRNLDYICKNGLFITLEKDKAAYLKSGINSSKPFVERFKNQRSFTINELKNSKLSLIIHDYCDHYWAFDLLKKEGLFVRYKNFFNQIGNPQSTDIFSREGELIASIMYDFRFSELPYFKHISFLSYEDIKEQLRDSQLSGENQSRAYQILQERQDF